MEQHTIGHFVYFLAIGAMTGWVAWLIARSRGYGIWGDIMIGIIGAMQSGWMAKVMGLSINGPAGEFLMAIVGALVLVGLTRNVEAIGTAS